MKPIAKVAHIEKWSTKKNCYQEKLYENMFVKDDIEDNCDDHDRYSLRPNLSLFNISIENSDHLSEVSNQERSSEHEWLDNIFHSTKIEDESKLFCSSLLVHVSKINK